MLASRSSSLDTVGSAATAPAPTAQHHIEAVDHGFCTSCTAAARGEGAPPLPRRPRVHVGRRGPDVGMRPVEDQQNRNRAARHPRQGAAGAAGRVRGGGGAKSPPGCARRPARRIRLVSRLRQTCCAGAWQDYLLLETAATGIAAYDAQQVPGLLQTPAYARALAETDPSLADDAARDQAAEAVIARQ